MSMVTKKALAASLKQLMSKVSLHKITVKDVVANCGLNRQTFYYHFKDIYDLLEWIYKTEAIDEFSSIEWNYNTWQNDFLKVFEYMYRNKEFCMNTFYSLGRENLETFLYDYTFQFFFQIAGEFLGDIKIDKDRKKFTADFFTYGFIGIFINWLKTGMKENPKNIIKNLHKLIGNNIDIIKVANYK